MESTLFGSENAIFLVALDFSRPLNPEALTSWFHRIAANTRNSTVLFVGTKIDQCSPDDDGWSTTAAAIADNVLHKWNLNINEKIFAACPLMCSGSFARFDAKLAAIKSAQVVIHPVVLEVSSRSYVGVEKVIISESACFLRENRLLN